MDLHVSFGVGPPLLQPRQLPDTTCSAPTVHLTLRLRFESGLVAASRGPIRRSMQRQLRLMTATYVFSESVIRSPDGQTLFRVDAAPEITALAAAHCMWMQRYDYGDEGSNHPKVGNSTDFGRHAGAGECRAGRLKTPRNPSGETAYS